MERRAHARRASQARGSPSIASAGATPASKRRIGRSFFGHRRSLRAVAVVAPGIAGVYWAAEIPALTFQRPRPEGRGFTTLRIKPDMKSWRR